MISAGCFSDCQLSSLVSGGWSPLLMPYLRCLAKGMHVGQRSTSYNCSHAELGFSEILGSCYLGLHLAKFVSVMAFSTSFLVNGFDGFEVFGQSDRE